MLIALIVLQTAVKFAAWEIIIIMLSAAAAIGTVARTLALLR